MVFPPEIVWVPLGTTVTVPVTKLKFGVFKRETVPAVKTLILTGK
jgi:hypothetical protein